MWMHRRSNKFIALERIEYNLNGVKQCNSRDGVDDILIDALGLLNNTTIQNEFFLFRFSFFTFKIFNIIIIASANQSACSKRERKKGRKMANKNDSNLISNLFI